MLSKDMDTDSSERDPFTDRASTFRCRSWTGSMPRPTGTSATSSTCSHTATSPAGSWATLESRRVAQPITPAGAVPTREQHPERQRVLQFRLAGHAAVQTRQPLRVIPMLEMFNTFNNKNNINPLVTPALFNFDGFLRLGVGDPRQVQLAVKFVF